MKISGGVSEFFRPVYIEIGIIAWHFIAYDDFMNRANFQQLVQLPGKRIIDNLEYVVDATKSPLKRLRSLTVLATGEWLVKLDGWYNPLLDSMSFTFSCAEADGKPICRIDVRGPEHDIGGRTHKHELRTENCPRQNLPHRIARPDLELMTPHEVWQNLCNLANIEHPGAFQDPR